jgi:hypothetical protein
MTTGSLIGGSIFDIVDQLKRNACRKRPSAAAGLSASDRRREPLLRKIRQG